MEGADMAGVTEVAVEVMAVVDSMAEDMSVAVAIGVGVTPVFTVTEAIAITAAMWGLGM